MAVSIKYSPVESLQGPGKAPKKVNHSNTSPDDSELDKNKNTLFKNHMYVKCDKLLFT